MRRAGRAEGFTLVEVLVSLAILGTAFFALLEAHYAGLRLYDSAWEEATLRGLTQQVLGLAELEVQAGNLSGEGDFGKRYPDYGYSFTAEADEENDLGFYSVAVTVVTPAEEDVELMFYMYDITRGMGAETEWGSGRKPGETGARTRSESSSRSASGSQRGSGGKPGSSSSRWSSGSSSQSSSRRESRR